MCRVICLALFGLLFVSQAVADDANRLTYLDAFCDPYYVHRDFPKLITPQWVGEEGVDTVVILSIDDLRDPPKYEAFIRPILKRVQELEGTSAMSVMTNWVDANDPLLQKWLAEGVALDAHTADHPCPCLQGGSFAKGKDTYDRCVDRLFEIPGNRPVAFRFPCMDSKNTPSPRMIAEALCRTTEKGHFLQIDTSVDNIFTADDPILPRDMVTDEDGNARFSKYIPFPSFVNKIENYPYPYIISRTMWEFPCMVPDDWQGFNLQKPSNPKTVEDWKACLDAAVLKQGIATFLFHPHGWIRNDQLVDIIDHAVEKHGKRVTFLQFRECLERINKNLLAGQPLRSADGADNGVRLLDLNGDGFIDVVIGNDQLQMTRIWQPAEQKWLEVRFPTKLIATNKRGKTCAVRVRFGILGGDVIALSADEKERGTWRFRNNAWSPEPDLLQGLELSGSPISVVKNGIDQGVRFRDLNADGDCELIIGSVESKGIFQWDSEKGIWKQLPFSLPEKTEIVFADGLDAGLRFVDVDEDGFDDVVFSDEWRFSLDLFQSMEKGWARHVSSGSRRDADAIPMISRSGTNNGAWFANNYIWLQNEDTARLPDGIDRMSFVDMLRPVQTEPKTAAASHKSIRVQPGFRVDLAAAEPLVMDPVSFDWGPDGKFWVVEMADYPLGIEGKPGGRVRYLQDTDGDGIYDKSTLFLAGLNFPNGVMAWDKGAIVSAAPEIFYAEDTNGDGMADKREVLYTGFVEGNQQHRVNGFWRGLDNWIYVANGDSGGKIKSTKTGKTIDISGRDLRIRPDTGELEAVTGRSQYGRTSDDWGNWFGCSNSQPVFHFVVDEHYYLRNPSVAVKSPVQWISTVTNTPIYPRSRVLSHWSGYRPPPAGEPSRFTSANGINIYRDELFGPAFQNMAFVSEPVHNLIHRHQLQPDGVTFSGQRVADDLQSEFLASSDSWFRPTAIRTGPDGALWFADMYRLVIEHPQWIDDEEEKRIDLRSGHDKGRIYRVLPITETPVAIPRFDRLTNQELAAQLASTNAWHREMAQSLLIERNGIDIVPELEKMATQSELPLARLHALCTLDGLNSLREEILVQATQDQHPGVRRHAIRLSEPKLDESPALQTALTKMREDPDPQVVLQLAYSLGQWHDPAVGKLLAELVIAHNDSPYIVAAAHTSLNPENYLDAYEAIMEAAQARARLIVERNEMIRLGIGFGQAKLTGKIAADLLSSDSIEPVAQLLTAMRHNRVNPDDVLSDETRAKLTSWIDKARQTIKSGDAPLHEMRQAIKLLAQGAGTNAEDLSLLQSLLQPQQLPVIQITVVQELASIDSDSVARSLIRQLSELTPAVRLELIKSILSRSSWSAVLLSEIESNQISAAQLSSTTRQRLTGHPNEKIAAQAQALFSQVATSPRNEVLQKYQETWSQPGNLEHGRELFRKHCSVCHRLEGEGHAVGPDLTGLTNKSPEALGVAILDPNRAVEDKFIEYAVLTRDGRNFSGVLANESGTSITLQGQDGKQQIVLREEIEEFRSTGHSLMPEGFEKVLDQTALSDLIRYVAETKVTPAKTP